ncbi:MAG: Gfo/Idh/MocA family protein [Terriglobia bacterium]
MAALRFAMFGAGFWSHYQLAGWKELGGVECVALCDRVRSKAEARAEEFGVPRVYDDPEQIFKLEKLDFVDVVTSPETHGGLVHLAAANKLPVICQKPMAVTYQEAEGMVSACREAGVPFFVHENWRWQTPIRELKRVLDGGRIGAPFRARLRMVSGFPVFRNQPFLAELEEFVLTDVGTHLLDAARFLFGEVETLYCQTHRVHANIKGEDVATVMMKTRDGVTVMIELGYAENFLENDRFPETLAFIEGSCGSVELAGDFRIRVTTEEGTLAKRFPPPRYSWVDPAYAVVQSSIVACHANILRALKGEGPAETTGEDNLKTLRLVFAAYKSAQTGSTILIA